VKALSPDTTRATEQWFLQHGLAYFVPEERHAARAALRPRRVVPLVAAVVLLATGAGGLLAWVSQQVTVAPALLLSLGLAAATWYALTALRARPIVTWALARAAGSLRTLLPMATRALPLLLMFITFLFINTEVWMIASALDGGVLWSTVMLFAAVAVGFLVVRLTEEVDRLDDEVGREELGDDADVVGLQRTNLVLVLLITQAFQVLLLALAVFAFFIVFGVVAMDDEVLATWIESDLTYAWSIPVSRELLQVSTFLAAFSGLYFAVYAVTDENYRREFFTEVLGELEQALRVGVRYIRG
jgi:hypothetical protein